MDIHYFFFPLERMLKFTMCWASQSSELHAVADYAFWNCLLCSFLCHANKILSYLCSFLPHDGWDVVHPKMYKIVRCSYE